MLGARRVMPLSELSVLKRPALTPLGYLVQAATLAFTSFNFCLLKK
jgi:hypothetical protein